MTERSFDRKSLMQDFGIFEKLDEIMTNDPDNRRCRREMRRSLEMLLDRAFDAGVICGINKLINSLTGRMERTSNAHPRTSDYR